MKNTNGTLCPCYIGECRHSPQLLGMMIALYFVIKWAVKNGIKEAYSAITGKKTVEDIQNEKELKELGLDSEDQ